jgi:antitoxin YefM
MKIASYSELRANLAAMLDSVERDHAPIVITRDRGKPAAVLMSLEDYASWEETIHLLKSPRNAERLLASISRFEARDWLDKTEFFAGEEAQDKPAKKGRAKSRA